MRKFQKYSTKITDFGNYREVTTFHSPQLRSSQEGRHKGGRSADSVISDEAQQERTEKTNVFYKTQNQTLHTR